MLAAARGATTACCDKFGMLQLSSQMSDSREKEAPASASGFHALGPGPGTDVIPPEQLSLCLNICPWPESYAACLLRRASIRCRFEMGLLPILLCTLGYRLSPQDPALCCGTSGTTLASIFPYTTRAVTRQGSKRDQDIRGAAEEQKERG